MENNVEDKVQEEYELKKTICYIVKDRVTIGEKTAEDGSVLRVCSRMETCRSEGRDCDIPRIAHSFAVPLRFPGAPENAEGIPLESASKVGATTADEPRPLPWERKMDPR